MNQRSSSAVCVLSNRSATWVKEAEGELSLLRCSGKICQGFLGVVMRPPRAKKLYDASTQGKETLCQRERAISSYSPSEKKLLHIPRKHPSWLSHKTWLSHPPPPSLAQHHKPQLEQQERRTRVHSERLSGLRWHEDMESSSV